MKYEYEGLFTQLNFFKQMMIDLLACPEKTCFSIQYALHSMFDQMCAIHWHSKMYNLIQYLGYTINYRWKRNFRKKPEK